MTQIEQTVKNPHGEAAPFVNILDQVVFSSGPRDPEGVAELLNCITDVKKRFPGTIIFVDMAPTQELFMAIKTLAKNGNVVKYFDHHLPEQVSNPKEVETQEWASSIEALLPAGNFSIGRRSGYPSCFSLVQKHEFDHKGVVVAHNDLDGALSAAHVIGCFKDILVGVAADADVLDGARSERVPEKLTQIGLAADQGFAALPAFNKDRPDVRAKAFREHCSLVVASYMGKEGALEILQKRAREYISIVAESTRLAVKSFEVKPGWIVCDTRTSGRYDLGELTRLMLARPGAEVTVIIKSNGPIAAKCGGTQVSIARSPKSKLNLQELVMPTFPGVKSDDSTGLIYNMEAMVHMSLERWDELLNRK